MLPKYVSSTRSRTQNSTFAYSKNVTAACPLEVQYERVGESNASVVEIGRAT